jgi:hypothetical protein
MDEDVISQTSTGRVISRRTFVRAGGTVVAALAVPESTLARRLRRGRRHHHKKLVHHVHATNVGSAPAPEAAVPQLSPLVRSSYTPIVGQNFGVAGSAGGVQLVDVQDLNSAQAGSENAFAIVLVSPTGDQTLADGLPEFSHPDFGTFALMLVSGTSDSTGAHYVAVINRDHA